MTMHSCIYQGKVRHRRFSPVRNAFRYRLFMMYLDLSELEEVFRGRIGWSYNRFNLAYLRRADHLGDPAVPLDQAVRDLVEQQAGFRPQGPVRLLTHLRYFGHCFNPVSFYYCYDAAGQRVETIVAEVHNTPWLEEHCYVFTDAHNQHPSPYWRRFQFAKAFHVSPFMPMDIHYDWRFREPDGSLNVHLINLSKGRRIFDATLYLQRRAISGRTLARTLLRYPFMTGKVVAMIHWQAVRLWAKGATFFVHPAKRR